MKRMFFGRVAAPATNSAGARVHFGDAAPSASGTDRADTVPTVSEARAFAAQANEAERT